MPKFPQDTPTGYLKTLKFLQQERQPYEPDLDDIRQYILPRRGLFTDRGEEYNRGSRQNRSKRVRGFATRALRLTAGGIFSTAVSPGRLWHKMAMEDPDADRYKPFREYLDLAEEHMMRIYRGTNFYPVMATAITEVCGFGTAVVFCDEDEKRVVRYTQSPMGEYYIDISEDYVPDVIYQLTELPALALYKLFEDSVSQRIETMLEHNPYKRVKVVRVCEPNPDYKEDSLNPKYMRYRTRWFEYEGHNDRFLKEGGYRERPSAAARWGTNASEAYGEGPCHDCVQDVKQIQSMWTDVLMASKLGVKPPLTGPADLTPNIVPGGYTPRSDPNSKIEPLFNVNFRTDQVWAAIQDHMQEVREALFNDIFMLPILPEGEGRRTAYEVSVRESQKVLLMGPITERVL
jgi:hypothetical protein